MSGTRVTFGRIVLAFVGLAVLVAGMALTAGNAYFLIGASETTGTVVSLAWEGAEGNEQRPSFAFTDAQGRDHVAATDYASSSHAFAIGDQAPILYNLGRSNFVRLAGLANGWVPGIVAALLGIFMLRQAFRRRRAVVSAPIAAPWTDAAGDPVQVKAMIEEISHRHEKPGTARPVAEPARKPAPPEHKAYVPTVRRMR